MLYKPQYDENGKKILCEMNGKQANGAMLHIECVACG